MTSPFPQLVGQDEERELVNSAFESIDFIAVYANADLTSTGLTWGYYGGRWSGFSVAAGTFTLTNAATNYIVVARSTGVTTCSTSATNWNDSANYARVFKVTTAGSVVTATEDHRSGAGGVHGALASNLVIGVDVQAYDADLSTIAGLTATTDNFMQAKSSAWASRTIAQVLTDLQGTGLLSNAAGFRHIPQNSKSAAYTTVAADSGGHIFHPSADTTARTWTIDSNANVAYPIGTAITFINQNAAGVITISITSDTLRLAGPGTTGSRALAANGVATAVKVTSTEWIISGTGLT